ncbi:MAG TPA: polysaccharide deacetylase family protein [Bacteroidia bacterium]|nr:polysaccharide deacetylase family protein [Bacteroidia bacterium]
MNTYYKIKRAIACKFLKKNVSLNLTKPIISFSFDDIPDSAVTNGARILNRYGYKATFYVSLGLQAEDQKDKMYFDHSKLRYLAENGNELACHTADHIRLYESNSKEILANLKKNQQLVQGLIPGYKFENFSYPSGQQTFRSKLILKKEYTSARGVNAGMHKKKMDMYNLHANVLAMHIPLQQIFALIDEAIEHNAWLILYTHEVEENPTKNGCTPEYFESIARYCFNKKVEVLTINKAINKIVSGKDEEQFCVNYKRTA